MTVEEAKGWLKVLGGTLNKEDKRVEAVEMAIEALDELHAYGAIGTIERFRELTEKVDGNERSRDGRSKI